MATQTVMKQPSIYPLNRTDVADAVRAALAQKGRAPFIGIACGQKTVLVRREVFKKSLAGLRIVDAELVTAEDGMITGRYARLVQTGGGTVWNGSRHEDVPSAVSFGSPVDYRATHAIRVYAACKGVKATRLFLHQDPRDWRNQRVLNEWKRREWKKADKPTRPKENKYQKQIGVLSRKLAKLGELQRPKNPAVAEPVKGGSNMDWHLWHLQKPVRKAVMALARRKDLTSAQLYREMEKLTVWVYERPNFMEYINWDGDGTRPELIYALAEKPLTFTRWGEVSGKERERKGVSDIWEYLARLWEFCRLERKPGSYDWNMPKWGPERYYRWQAERNERREIENMIAALRAEAPHA